jgi:CHAT domain-containing protein/tetratricopeptide (TPR) repeat protein
MVLLQKKKPTPGFLKKSEVVVNRNKMIRFNGMIINTLIVLFAISALPLSGQVPEGEMKVVKDSAGKIVDAMYYLRDDPVSEIVSELNLLAFKKGWQWNDVLGYLNQSLHIKLEPTVESAICLERIGDYLYNHDKNLKGAYLYYTASAGMLHHLGNAEREAYMDYYTGMLCCEMGKKREADEYFRKMAGFYDSNPGINSDLYARFLVSVIDRLYLDKNYQEAIFYLEKYTGKGEKFQATAAELGQSWLMLGYCYRKSLRKEEAIHAYLNAIPFLKTTNGKQSEYFNAQIFEVADFLYNAGKKTESLPLYEKLFSDIDSYDLENQSLICAKMLDGYLTDFQFQEMVPVMEKMKRITSTGGGKYNQLYISVNSTIASLYQRLGRYNMTETLLLENIGLLEKEGKMKAVGLTWMELSGMYLKMAMPERSIELVDKGYKIICAAGKPGKQEQLYFLKIKGIASMLAGDYNNSSILLQQALEIQPKKGIHGLDYAATLGLVGLNHWYKKEYEEARDIMLDALAMISEEKYLHTAEFGNLNCNIALAYGSLEQYDKSVEHLKIAVDIIGKASGKTHPDYLIQLSNYSKYIEAVGQDSMAIAYALQANELFKQLIDKFLMYWSTQEMEIFISNYAYRFLDHFNSLYFRQSDKHPELTVAAYNNQLFMKGLLLSSSVKFQQAIQTSGDTTITLLAREIAENQAKLEKLYAVSVQQRTEPTEPVEQHIADLQKRLKTRLSVISQQKGGAGSLSLIDGVTCMDVAASLAPDEAAIEFISFRYHDIVIETDTVKYAALILRHGFTHPVMVYLCNELDLSPLLSKHPDELYAPGDLTLGKLLWEPVEQHLQGVRTIFYAPSGLLNRIAFAAIPTDGQKVLSDRYRLFLVSSTRKVLEKNTVIDKGLGFLFGGIDYNAKPLEEKKMDLNVAFQECQDSTLLRGLRGNSWQYLPGTMEEVKKISSLLQSGGADYTLYSGKEASEAIFRELPEKSPSIVHVASHGFTIPENPLQTNGTGATLKAARHDQNPLSRCGLLFAGANLQNTGRPSADDGILTAFELAGLDFRSVDLFVLSACETGLGEIKGSEGVFGLQRALFMSGAGSIVVSLWEVPDFETTELMTHFYTGISKGLTPEDAFYNAQHRMKETYPDQPSLWAGFVFCR